MGPVGPEPAVGEAGADRVAAPMAGVAAPSGVPEAGLGAVGGPAGAAAAGTAVGLCAAAGGLGAAVGGTGVGELAWPPQAATTKQKASARRVIRTGRNGVQRPRAARRVPDAFAAHCNRATTNPIPRSNHARLGCLVVWSFDSHREGTVDYDVLIVGARVAGASLALLLGERGHRVLLVDRDRFPSDTLSTHFVGPQHVPLLAKLGVLEDVEASGLRRIRRSRTYVEDLVFEGPMAPPYALAPRRDRFDAILVEHACRRGGVELAERTTAEGLVEEGGRVAGAVLRTAGGAARTVRARWVVGADGKFSKVAEWVGARSYEQVPALRPGYYGYFLGLKPLPETTLEIFFTPGQMGFIFPMEPGLDCLALELQPPDFDAFRAEPVETFLSRFRALPGMAERLADARLEDRIFGTRGVDNYLRQPYGPGWALNGDAGCLKDPSTGTGMGDALTQSFLLADALDAALRGEDEKAALGAFHQKRDEAMLPGYRFTIDYTRAADIPTEALDGLRGALTSPALARSLVAALPAKLPELMPSAMPRLTAIANGFAAARRAGGCR